MFGKQVGTKQNNKSNYKKKNITILLSIFAGVCQAYSKWYLRPVPDSNMSTVTLSHIDMGSKKTTPT